jgi:glyoxalase superfamily protein
MSGNGNGVGTFAAVALDCPDPKALAEFYSGIIGGKPEGEGEWVTLQGDTDVKLAFQQADEWSPPEWPGAEHPQQAHIDVTVNDLEGAEQQVLALGARKAEFQPGGTSFRVFLDPVGHPFCLCAQ